MNGILADVIISVLLAACVIAAGVYIYRQKKRGNGCAGCSLSGNCPHSSPSECKDHKKRDRSE